MASLNVNSNGSDLEIPRFSAWSKKYSPVYICYEDKIGRRDMDFPQGNVWKRDLKRKCIEHDDFTNGHDPLFGFNYLK